MVVKYDRIISFNHFKLLEVFMKFFAVLVSACIVLSGINVAEARRGGGSRTKSTTKTITTTKTANPAIPVIVKARLRAVTISNAAQSVIAVK